MASIAGRAHSTWLFFLFYLISCFVSASASETTLSVSSADARNLGGNVTSDERLAAVFVGLRCDGQADDAPALNAALRSGRATIILPAQTCRVGSTIRVPSGVTLEGAAFVPGNPPSGTRLLCNHDVTPCVYLGGQNGSPSLRSLVVDRDPELPLANSIGIEVADAYNVVVKDVMAHNHSVCFKFLGHSASGEGISAEVTRIFSGACSDVHLDIDTWAELRISQSRFGMNGVGDYDSNSFIRIEGGPNRAEKGSAAGPNTISVVNSQFNQGSKSSRHFLEFVRLRSPVPTTDATDFKISGVHVENVKDGDIFSDSSWNILDRMSVSASTFNDLKTKFFLLDDHTQLSEVIIEGNHIMGSMTVKNTDDGRSTNALGVHNNYIQGPVLFFGAQSQGGTLSEGGNMFAGGLEVVGSWGSLSIGPDIFVGTAQFKVKVKGNFIVQEPGFFIKSESYSHLQ